MGVLSIFNTVQRRLRGVSFSVRLHNLFLLANSKHCSPCPSNDIGFARSRRSCTTLNRGPICFANLTRTIKILTFAEDEGLYLLMHFDTGKRKGIDLAQSLATGCNERND